ncbi:hypothetical protein HOQ56_gp09 [uncultured phage_MedDCM-OCT-S38-C3]|uniref:Uncharacterized protein n=1 Tax=uncultured phage_MedDCM-OCT-S38-C3 TaxID=2740803 RepID=A0A6S4PMA9_9CAUD|nr:hypothetical protein HOQ56_gp09 [uncultured phage_MedDCM-OCT-S38-C3]BAQ94434.1 hypothetical protein [uncultured phage_MedDCM-OCT-S38-C3]
MALEPLMGEDEMRRILERGLVTGKWSIVQFNKNAKDPVLPSREFLEKNPKFLSPAFRDLEAYSTAGHWRP